MSRVGFGSRWPCVALIAFMTLSHMDFVRSQISEPGICPFSSPHLDWKEAQFAAGPWYEIKAFPFNGIHHVSPECTTWHFEPLNDGLGLAARLSYRLSDADERVNAFAQYTNEERYPNFNLTFHNIGYSSQSVGVKVLGTDYNDFAVIWGCLEPNLFERRVVSWVLSRQPYLSRNAQESIHKLFTRHDIRAEKLVETDHRNCGHPPTTTIYDTTIAIADDALAALSVLSPEPEDKGQFSASSEAEVSHAASVQDNTVSWSYVGDVSSPQFLLLAALLAFVAVSLVVSVLAFRALLQRAPAKAPVLPMSRDHVPITSISDLSSDFINHTRFGALRQTRKSGTHSLNDWS